MCYLCRWNCNRGIIMKKDKKYDIAIFQAQRYNLEKEFINAYKFFNGNVIYALEEWDLLTDDVLQELNRVDDD